MDAMHTKKGKASESAAAGSDAGRKPDFERSLGRLEEVVRRLEHPNLPLDDAMNLFQEGIELAQQCQKQLEEAEGRVEILLKSAGGKLAAAPFQPDGPGEADGEGKP
jgi:exodeoxyribonuclease VII small subunit